MLLVAARTSSMNNCTQDGKERYFMGRSRAATDKRELVTSDAA